MQAVLIHEVGGFELGLRRPRASRARTGRSPGARASVTGLCRTDLKIVRHGHRDLTLPRIPGEEVVGEIVALGPEGPAAARPSTAAPAAGAAVGVAATGAPDPFAPGDTGLRVPRRLVRRVPELPRGAENLCRQMRIMGFHRDGGFADYVAAPLQSLIRVPDLLGDEEAVFAEPLSCCLNALELGGAGEGDVLGVWGAGPAGTLLSRAGALRGAEVVVVEPDPRRREFVTTSPCAPQVSAHERAPGLVDVAVVAVGDPAAYEAAIAALAPRGRLVVFGLLPPPTRTCTSVSAASTTTSTRSSALTAAASATASRPSTSWPAAVCASTT